jgi:ribosomal protein S18 acetylase RimI-like enzyme
VSFDFSSLLESASVLSIFFDRFKEISIERGGDEISFDGIIATKSALIDSGGITGWVMWERLEPVGLAWVERVTPTYGSILLYTCEPRYKQALVTQFLDSGIARGVMSELLQFDFDDDFNQLLRDRGLLEIPRQRMVCHLPETPEYPTIPEGFSLLPLTSKTMLPVSELSMESHRISGDYKGFADMETIEGRLKLEGLVHSGFYGKVIQPATLGMVQDGAIHCITLNVQIACWGQDRIPWIFDISTAPKSMGNGLGEWLLKYTKAVMVDMQYPMWGLAVTMSNAAAIKVYERNDFIPVDSFSEFLQ